jgi:hypothetical protein
MVHSWCTRGAAYGGEASTVKGFSAARSIRTGLQSIMYST